MSQEVAAALIGAGVGGILTAAVTVMLHLLQRKDGEEDWRRTNQRDIDWKVEEFVIDVHDFYRNPTIEKRLQTTDFQHQSLGSYLPAYDSDRGRLLHTRAEAYQDRVTDPVLKECLRIIRLELRKANQDLRIVDGMEAPIHDNCKRFYRRIAELYGDPSKVSTQEQDDAETMALIEERVGVATGASSGVASATRETK